MELTIFDEEDQRIRFIKQALKRRLISFIEDGLEWVLISGQMGVELWTAEVVLDLKETYDINIAVTPPFENQQSRWPEPLQHKYEELMLTADFFQPIYKGDYKGPFQFKAKDMWLVEKSDASLILMDEENPGSAGYFYEVAKSVEDYPVYFITPFDLDEVVEEIHMSESEYEDGHLT